MSSKLVNHPLPAHTRNLDDATRAALVGLSDGMFNFRLMGLEAEALYSNAGVFDSAFNRHKKVLSFRSHSEEDWWPDELVAWGKRIGCEFPYAEPSELEIPRGSKRVIASLPNKDGVAVTVERGPQLLDCLQSNAAPLCDVQVASKAELAFDALRIGSSVVVDHSPKENLAWDAYIWDSWDRLARMQDSWDEESLATAFLAVRDLCGGVDGEPTLPRREGQTEPHMGQLGFTLSLAVGFAKELPAHLSSSVLMDHSTSYGRHDIERSLSRLSELGQSVGNLDVTLASANVEKQAWAVAPPSVVQNLDSYDRRRWLEIGEDLMGRPLPEFDGSASRFHPRSKTADGHDMAWAVVNRKLSKALSLERESNANERQSELRR